MKYSTTDIAKIVAPIAERHNLKAVYLFGSYARGKASNESDVDLLIDSSTAPHKGLQYFDIIADFEQSFGEGSVDIIDMNQVTGMHLSEQNKILAEAILPERVLLYGKD